MKGLLPTISCDIKLQLRNGFYYATLFVVIFFILGLSQLPEIDWNWLLPLVIVLNMNYTAFYFVGGLLLLEKDQGTLSVQGITPLKAGEYLLSKILSLSMLIIIESTILVIVLYGFSFNIFFLIAGTILAAAIYILSGFLAVVPYQSISDYILPSVGYAALVSIPLLTGFTQWNHWIIYLHPLQGPLILLNTVFMKAETWQLIYGFVYSLIWCSILFAYAKRAYSMLILGE
ncbi:MAG: ABC transporter permease [Halanaerobiales bacterium]